jgi:arginyl-tRNA synthetase
MTIKYLFEEAEEILKNAGLSKPILEIPKKIEFGEISCISCFEDAKKLGLNPIEFAKKISSRIILKKDGLLKNFDIKPPGYINFYVDWIKYTEATIKNILKLGNDYGKTNIGKDKRIFLEHTSVNPNKALHIGHARNVCLGDVLYRILSFSGYKVIVANYVDDSGSQMADILLGFLELGYPMEAPKGIRFDEYCGDKIYVEVNNIIQKNPELERKKKAILKEIENVKSEIFKFNREIAEKVLKDQLETCWKLGARYDIINRELDIIVFGLWNKIFNKLKEAGIIYLSEKGDKAGCWLIDLSKHPILSKEEDEVILRSDLTITYIAKDIAYAAWKLGLLSDDFKYSLFTKNPDGTPLLITDFNGKIEEKFGGCDRAISVIDVRQSRPQEIIKYVLSHLGVEPEKYIHFSYEVVSLSSKDAEKIGMKDIKTKIIHMEGRKGIYIKVEEILNMLKEKFILETKKRHPEWNIEKINKTAEALAIASLRYELIKSDIDKIIVFDSEKAMKIEGNTGPYLQYTFARACRIIEKAGIFNKNLEVFREPNEYEKNVIRQIALFPLIVEEVAKTLFIKKLVNYTHQLALCFNDFYEKCQVISSNEKETNYRLAIVTAFKQTLNNCLYLLGLPIIEEM